MGTQEFWDTIESLFSGCWDFFNYEISGFGLTFTLWEVMVVSFVLSAAGYFCGKIFDSEGC